jgi:hypothetical protein
VGDRPRAAVCDRRGRGRLRRAGERSAGPERSPTLARWAVGGLALALVALLSVFLLAPASSASALGSPRGGPTVLAILLLLAPTRREDKPAALPCALLLALLAAAPASGQGDALELLAISRDLLVDLGLGWAFAGALAGSLAAAVMTLGVGICAASLIARPEPPGPSTTARHTRALLLAVGLALALGVGLALRKPGDDLALLQGAAALLLLATTRARSRAGDHGLAIVCALAAAAPLLDAEARDSLATALVGVGSLLCLAVGFARSRGSAPLRSNG